MKNSLIALTLGLVAAAPAFSGETTWICPGAKTARHIVLDESLVVGDQPVPLKLATKNLDGSDFIDRKGVNHGRFDPFVMKRSENIAMRCFNCTAYELFEGEANRSEESDFSLHIQVFGPRDGKALDGLVFAYGAEFECERAEND